MGDIVCTECGFRVGGGVVGTGMMEEHRLTHAQAVEEVIEADPEQVEADPEQVVEPAHSTLAEEIAGKAEDFRRTWSRKG